MKRISLPLIIVILIIFGGNTFAAQPSNGLAIPLEDTTISILKLTHKRSGKEKFIVPGMNITYWKNEKSIFKKKKLGQGGIFKGFKGDSLIVEEKIIALSDITRIKGRNNEFGRGIIKGLSVGALAFNSFALGVVLFSKSNATLELLGVIALGRILITLSTLILRRLVQPPKIGKVYSASIVEVPLDFSQQVKEEATSSNKLNMRFIGNIILLGLVISVLMLMFVFGEFLAYLI